MTKKTIKTLKEAIYDSDKAFDPEYSYASKSGMHEEFDFNMFKSIPNEKDRLEYASKTLQMYKLGQGSSRIVYELPDSGGKVLKIARNNKGIAQNKSELDIAYKFFSNPDIAPIVAKIYGHDDLSNPTWLVSEQVEPLNGQKQKFYEVTDMTYNQFLDLFEFFSPIYGKAKNLLFRVNYALQQNPYDESAIKTKELLTNNEFGKTINALLLAGIEPGDIKTLGHWGVTDKGNIVLLDYGLTSDVAKKHYGNIKDREKTNRFDEGKNNKSKGTINMAIKTLKEIYKQELYSEAPAKMKRRGRPTLALQNAIRALNDMPLQYADDDDGEEEITAPVPSANKKKMNNIDLGSDNRPNFAKPIDPEFKEDKFNFDEYRKLPTPTSRLAYARNTLGSKELGAGSSRIVYDMGNTGKVLKIALNNKGVAQNKEELEITKKIHSSYPEYPIVTKVYGHDNSSEPTWLVSEKVRPIENSDITRETKGVLRSMDQLTDIFQSMMGENIYNLARSNPDVNFFKGLQAIPEVGMLSGDLVVSYHWGVTEDGRIVVLDYGFTRDVADKHYGWNKAIATIDY